MAALGTIRKRGVILVCIISFGLFAFIAEEAFRSCDSAKNNERQQIGEVLGEKISVQDFQLQFLKRENGFRQKRSKTSLVILTVWVGVLLSRVLASSL